MRTAESIEAAQASQGDTVKPERKSGKKPMNPRSLANLVAPWTPETAPKSAGRPKKDMAQRIAKQVFENNPEMIYKAFSKSLAKGGAFAFQVLSDRAYGKLKETREIGQEYNDVPDGDIQDEIERIMSRLGLAREADAAAEAGVSQARAGESAGKAQNSDVLP